MESYLEMKVTLFGQLKEMAPGGIVDLPPVADVTGLKGFLEEKFSILASLPYVVAVDKMIVTSNAALTPGQEIAIMPPYSGG